MTRQIVLDTDIGSDVDDALCLALALASPELEVVAVTHVTGDTRRRARISKTLLQLAGRPDIPVYAGCETPLSTAASFFWSGHEGDGIVEPGSTLDIEVEDAADALIRLFHGRDGLELVAVGPLTNIAVALQREPALARRICQLTIMGGHIRGIVYAGHEFPPGVDYNLCSDPAASLHVLGAGIPTRLVTGDVTLQVWLTAADLAAIEAGGTPLQHTLARAVRIWTPAMNQIFSGMGAPMTEDNVAFLHDPLALACVYDESFCTFEDLAIEPAIVAGIFRTLERPAGSPQSFPMRCATAVDAMRVRSHVVERLRGFRRAD